jgi:hypothetical protein
MKSAISAVLAATLFVAVPAFAASDSQSVDTLAPGGPAGVQKAQDFSWPAIISIVGVLGVGVAVAILVSNGSGSSATKTTGQH